MARSSYSPHIPPEEWRWVIIASSVLAIVTLLPYAWALAGNNTAPDVQFMGILANPRDGATYLAKMEQGYRGSLLFHLPYTPEPHSGTALNLFYLFLGHVARITHLESVIIYHVARVLGGLFMFIALYQLGASIWTQRRPRRLFFGLSALGSGLGWLAIVVDPGMLDIAHNRLIPDLTIPEAYPLYAVYTNPHFPLAIGILALVGSIYIQIFRPGAREDPTLYNQGLILTVASVALSLIQPQALVPVGVVLGAYLCVRGIKTRKFPLYEATWCIPLWFPAAPFLAYYFAITQTNPAIQAWSTQNLTPSPPPHYYLIGFLPLIVVALPGLARALRRFEPDGDQLMLTWLVVNSALLYAPINLQRRFAIGLIVPLTYFAVRGLEDYWVNAVPRALWRPALIGLFVVMLPSSIMAMGGPLFGAVFNIESGVANNLLLEKAYVDTLGWLRTRIPLRTEGRDTVVLAAPDFSMFIPAWAGQRVAYGHPYETIDAAAKEAQVKAWYRGAGCQALLDGAVWGGSRWRVDYVVVGPRERKLGLDEDGNPIPGADACYAALGDPIGIFGKGGEVALYKVR
ncbi:MAG: hypothetical protein JXB47_02490 [Anaerolineae bacterium]|nr:hypothetical protein [Anaerolineae bacterium]